MRPEAIAFASRTATAFVELLALAEDALESASKHIEAGDFVRAAGVLRTAADLSTHAAGGAARLAGALDAEASQVAP